MASTPSSEIDTPVSGHSTGLPLSGAAASVEAKELEEACTLQLNVRLLSGEDLGRFPMVVDASVLDLKRVLLQLPALKSTGLQCLRLVLGSQVLRDHQKLGAVGVPSGAHLQAMLCPRRRAEVVLRCRPLSERRGEQPHQHVLELDSAQGMVTFLEAEPNLKVQLDGVYAEASTQEELFVGTAQSFAEDVVQGQSGLILCYGVTGSGKRHTLFGGHPWLHSLAARRERRQPLAEGILPRSFDRIAACLEDLSEVPVVVSVSFVTFICEQVYDMLDGGVGPLTACEMNCWAHVCVEGVTRRIVHSAKDMRGAFAEGWARHADWIVRMGGSDSTRIHMVFTVQVDTYRMGDDGRTYRHSSTLRFAKLAGSEEPPQREARQGLRGLPPGCGLRPACGALDACVRSLAGKSKGGGRDPWQESRISLLLRDELQGAARTLLIATCRSEQELAAETRRTLRLAQDMRSVEVPPMEYAPVAEGMPGREFLWRRRYQ